MEHDARRGLTSPPWADLPADALSEIAGRLHDAGDLVRFRAVCRPWRGAPPRPRAPSFLPWIVESFVSDDGPGVGVRLHSPFSTRKTRHLLPISALRGRTISWSKYVTPLAVGYSDEDPTLALINPLDDGDSTSLPPLPLGGKWRSARVSSDGGVVGFLTTAYDYLAAILLRPGEPGWEGVEVTRPVGVDAMYPLGEGRRTAALWSPAIPHGVTCGIATLPPRPHGGSERYMLEFHGELVCVDIIC